MGGAAPGAKNDAPAQFPASTDGPMPSRHAAIDGKEESARARTSMPGTPPTLPPRASYRPPDSGASRDRTGIGALRKVRASVDSGRYRAQTPGGGLGVGPGGQRSYGAQILGSASGLDCDHKLPISAPW